jgi:hypothetical protein
LLGYRATSNQDGIEKVKRQIAAGLFEIRLFNDDLRAILSAQGRILRHNFEYLRLNLVPMLWMLIPFVLVVAQLQFHYGFGGLETDRPTLLSVTLHEGAADDVRLELPDGLRMDSPRVWIPGRREASWRLVPERPGTYDVTVRVADAAVVKRLVVSDDVARRAPDRLSPGFLDQLLYPAEAPLPADGPVARISVRYADREVGLFGWETHWLIVFLILSVGFAFAMKGRFGVTI